MIYYNYLNGVKGTVSRDYQRFLLLQKIYLSTISTRKNGFAKFVLFGKISWHCPLKPRGRRWSLAGVSSAGTPGPGNWRTAGSQLGQCTWTHNHLARAGQTRTFSPFLIFPHFAFYRQVGRRRNSDEKDAIAKDATCHRRKISSILKCIN